MPTPFLVNAPPPLIAPLKVEVVPASARNVPPPALSAAAVSAWPGMRMRSVRWEQSATEDAEDEARIEATPTIDSQ